MNSVLQTARRDVAAAFCLVLFAMAPTTLLHADELSASIEAAAKATDAAQSAASAALAAAKAATDDTLAAAAADAALRAAEAASAAADAATTALAAARAAASSAAPPAAAAAAAQTVASAPAASGSGYDEHVKCEGGNCKIDLWLTRGFRAFSQCQVCHGLDGNGSSFAPSLVEKLQAIDRARFDDVVANGYKGQIGVMPAWKTNPNVMKYLDNLYAYLKARSDGVLPAGKLQRYDR